MQNARKDTANIAVTVGSKCLHCLISRRKLQQSVCWRLMSHRVLSRRRLCRAITHDQLFPLCAVPELLFYKSCAKFSATEMMKRMQNIFQRILCREVLLEGIQPFIRGIRWDFREIWTLTINLLNSTVFYLSLLVGHELLICVSYDNENFKQTIISSNTKHSPPKPTHSNAHFSQTIHAGPVKL